MTKFDVQKGFGQLRSLLNQGAWSLVDRWQIWRLIDSMAGMDEAQYFESWLPYIQSFQRLFDGCFLTLDQLDPFLRACHLMPHALLGVQVISNSEKMGDSFIQTLETTGCMSQVAALNLYDCGVTDDGLGVLARSSQTTHIRTLYLWVNQFTPAGVESLARSSHLGGLLRLSLMRHVLSDDCLVALLQSPVCQALQFLDLSETGCGDAVARVLSTLPVFSSLSTLNLDRNVVTDTGARYLIESRDLNESLVVQLYENPISAPLIEQLNIRFHCRSL